MRGGGGYLGWGTGARLALENASDSPAFVRARAHEWSAEENAKAARVVLTDHGRAILATPSAGPTGTVGTLLFHVGRGDTTTAVSVWAVVGAPGAKRAGAVAITARCGEGRVALWGFDLTAAPEWLVAAAAWSAGCDRRARPASFSASLR